MCKHLIMSPMLKCVTQPVPGDFVPAKLDLITSKYNEPLSVKVRHVLIRIESEAMFHTSRVSLLEVTAAGNRPVRHYLTRESNQLPFL